MTACSVPSSPPVPRPVLLVVAALIADGEGRFLLAQRRPGGPLGLTWEFPGGKLHPGESPEAALVREMDEELGVDVEILAPWRFVSHPYEAFHLLMTVFHGRIVGERRPMAREVADWGWFRVEEMADLPMPPADLPLVAWLRQDFPE
ncbi:MAG: (deoxy)nucleoside triphosphate pyrophosphohydrolase [Magnetococcales bacterium]|nr:(deoxy)nucleoside triphosphate pyrophosphohydrolase [Magnetococcales bacterium]